MHQIGNKIKKKFNLKNLRIEALYLTVGSQNHAVTEHILIFLLLTNTTGKVIMLVKSPNKFQSNHQREGRKKIGKEGRKKEGGRERKKRQRENGDMVKSWLETIKFGCYFIFHQLDVILFFLFSGTEYCFQMLSLLFNFPQKTKKILFSLKISLSWHF